MEVLRIVKSPTRIAEIVRRWPHLKTRGLAVDGCVVKKVRPTDEGELEMEYQLKLVNCRTAEPFKATILGRIYPDGKAEKKYRKLLESFEGKDQLSEEPNLRNFALFVPELSMLLRSPCMDEKLPGLDVVLDAEAMIPILAPFLDAETGGRERIRACAIETLRYKAGKRYILRYLLETEDAGGRSFIGKMYSDPVRAKRVYAVMRAMAQHGFGRDAADGIRIPYPYGYVDELQMIVMEDVSGTQLKEDLSAARFVDDLRAAAHALVKIHRCPVQTDSQHREKTDKKYQPEEQIVSLQDWAARAIQVDPAAKEAIEETLATIVALDHDLEAFEPALVHASFSLREILVGESGITIVDLDRVCNADPAMDLGKLLANLKHKADEEELPHEVIRGYTEAFLEAYDPKMPAELLRRADYYYRVCLLKVACRCACQPDKQHLVGALLDEALWGLPHS